MSADAPSLNLPMQLYSRVTWSMTCETGCSAPC